MEKVIYHINGIRNDTEKIQIKKALEKIDGVNKISIDRAENQIEVDYNKSVSRDDISNCILSTGHEIKDME